MSKRWNPIVPIAAFVVAMSGCVTDENSPGLEYMPDMYRSPAVEAYVDYGMDPYYVTEEVAVGQQHTECAEACGRHHSLCWSEQSVWASIRLPQHP